MPSLDPAYLVSVSLSAASPPAAFPVPASPVPASPVPSSPVPTSLVLISLVLVDFGPTFLATAAAPTSVVLASSLGLGAPVPAVHSSLPRASLAGIPISLAPAVLAVLVPTDLVLLLLEFVG